MAIFTSRPGLCALLFSILICALLAFTGIPSRPAFPVDETRYLTVAWEMFSRQEWVLPTLNFEPYSHKPPLLFWLVMLSWGVFGVSQPAALAVPFIISFAVAAALFRMARTMMPETAVSSLAVITTMLLLGSLPFMLYGQLIMFDMLLTLFVILGMTSIWQFAHTGRFVHAVILGVCIGLGALVKGPVILLHLVFPVLLTRIWMSKDECSVRWGKWITGCLLALVIGIGIGLSWAIPAAIKGGPEFAEKIFWGQTAGRMSKSFDHAHPVWWYLPFALLFTIPWIFHAGLWRGLRNLGTAAPGLRQPVKFIACWLIPTFISFSLISGKQVHYLLPMLPALILLFALGFERARSSISSWQAGAPLAFCMVVTLLPAAVLLPGHLIVDDLFGDRHLHIPAIVEKLSIPVSLSSSALLLVIAMLTLRRSLEMQLAGIALAMTITIGSVQFQARNSIYVNYDLTPIASEIVKLPANTPLAFVRNYHGEWGFLARLERPVKQIDIHELAGWFEQNPEGAAFIRTRDKDEYKAYDIITSQPYKMGHTYAIIRAPGKAPRPGIANHPLQ